MARSTYYFEINKTDLVAKRNAALSKKIKAIFEDHHGTYGVRRIYHELVNQGHKVNHKRVQRLMHQMRLCGKRPKEYTIAG